MALMVKSRRARSSINDTPNSTTACRPSVLMSLRNVVTSCWRFCWSSTPTVPCSMPTGTVRLNRRRTSSGGAASSSRSRDSRPSTGCRGSPPRRTRSRSPRLPAVSRSAAPRRGSAAGRGSPRPTLSLEDHGGGGDAGAVREAHVQVRHPPHPRPLRRRPAQREPGRAAVPALHFHLQKRHPLAPSRPQRLEARFLGGEPRSERLGLVRPRGAIVTLRGREHPLLKRLLGGEQLTHLPDFHDVEADAHDHPQSTLPPFTFRISPVMWPARSEQRNTMGPAQSSGLATRPSGIVRSMSSLPRPASLAYGVADISVSTHPGATQFTLIRRGASSTARDLVNEMTAPLVAA